MLEVWERLRVEEERRLVGKETLAGKRDLPWKGAEAAEGVLTGELGPSRWRKRLRGYRLERGHMVLMGSWKEKGAWLGLARCLRVGPDSKALGHWLEKVAWPGTGA